MLRASEPKTVVTVPFGYKARMRLLPTSEMIIVPIESKATF
jgi:hypothetical protein